MSQEVLKVLVSKEDLDSIRDELKELRAFKEKHTSTTSSAPHTLTKDGTGSQCPPDSDEICIDDSQKAECQCQNATDDCTYNQDLNTVLPKDPPKVPVENSPENQMAKFGKDEVLKRIWKRYHRKTLLLLDALEKSESFTVDRHSMVYIKDVPLNVSIFDLLKDCQHPVRKNLDRYKPFADLVKEMGLQKYLSNKYILISDNRSNEGNALDPYWYYIN